MMEQEDVIEIDQYNGVLIEEYKGVFGLIAMVKGGGQESRGVWYKKWMFLSRYKKGKPSPDKGPYPVAVRLGDKETAFKTLQALLADRAFRGME